MKNKPILGQTIYSLNVNNAARGKGHNLTPYEVTKVGRKYFEITNTSDGFLDRYHNNFHIDTWMENSNYVSSHKLYETKEEWEEEEEVNTLTNKFKEIFSHWSQQLPLDKLRKIDEVLRED